MLLPLIEYLKQHSSQPLCIYMHDFPDHDAVASAYALRELLAHYDIQASIYYSGVLESFSLHRVIQTLHIPIQQFDVSIAENMPPNLQIIAIDGLSSTLIKSNFNESIIALIDHHVATSSDYDYQFVDIRTAYGACSTIIWDYYKQADIPIPKNVATVLLIGIMMDTAFMTRSVTRGDLAAFNALFFEGDWYFASTVLRNSLSFADASIFTDAIQNCVIEGGFAFIALKEQYTAEVVALTADFFLGFREFNFVVACVPMGDEYRLSVRSDSGEYSCHQLLRTALEGIGKGGGHTQMSGGIIPRDKYPGNDELRQRFVTAIRRGKSE